jgi:hypothetical protein
MFAQYTLMVISYQSDSDNSIIYDKEQSFATRFLLFADGKLVPLYPDLVLVIGNEIATNGQKKCIIPYNLWICGKFCISSTFYYTINILLWLFSLIHDICPFLSQYLVRCWLLRRTLFLHIGCLYSGKLWLERGDAQPCK